MDIGERKPYKYLIYFIAAFVALYLTQEVLLNRLILIDRGYITGGTFVYFCSPLVTDVVAEVYGYRVARQMLWSGIIAMFFLAICVAIVLRLPYPPIWKQTADAYNIALSSTARAVVVGNISIMIGQFLNAYLISKWKVLVKGRYFWLRSVGSSIIGDTVTTGSAILTIFIGRVPLHALGKILFPELLIMLVCSILGGFPAWILVKILTKAEGVNVFDSGINFNPFKFSIED